VPFSIAGDNMAQANSTVNSSSYPFSAYNISLDLNLTANLTVNLTQLNPYILNTSNGSRNITLRFIAATENGTVVSDSDSQNSMDLTNVSGVWLRNVNLSTTISGMRDLSNNLSTGKTGASGNVICDASGGLCYVNATIPQGLPGGYYNVNMSLLWNTSNIDADGEYRLTGIGDNASLVLYDSGLVVTNKNSTSISVNESNIYYLYFNVTNWGAKTATGNITMQTCTYATIKALDSYNLDTGGLCHSSSPSNYFVLNPAVPSLEIFCSEGVTLTVIPGSVTESNASYVLLFPLFFTIIVLEVEFPKYNVMFEL